MEAHQEADPKMEAQERVQEFFLRKINEAKTPEEFLGAFGDASAAAEFAGLDEPTYTHPEGGTESLRYLFGAAKGYFEAAKRGDDEGMNSLSDVGLPPEFKEKARELAAAETPEE